jgi:hypothetical protein
MPKNMARLDDQLARQVDLSLKIVAQTEALWLTAPPTSDIRRNLKVEQLETLYEAAFLRIFTSWEMFLEEVQIRFMAGYATGGYQPAPLPGRRTYSTIEAARTALYDGRAYLLWHNPTTNADRCARWLASSPIETLSRANQAQLENFASVRHRIAHSSSDASAKFTAATLTLSGTTATHPNPGRFLRSPDISDPLNQPKWIRVVADFLVDLGNRILV